MERLLAGTGEDLDRANRLACDAACAEVRRALGAARFAAAWAAGEAVLAEQVIAEALQTLGLPLT
jgi:hypothetical protein